MAWPVADPSLSSIIKSCGQMYIQAVLSCPLQPSHFSVRTKVGIIHTPLVRNNETISSRQPGRQKKSTRRMAGELDLGLVFLGQAGIVGAQPLQHLGTRKLRR